MKTVTLFRHAKSGDKDNPAIADVDRPLSGRGLKAAPKVGAVLRDRHLRPDLILCSPSERTRQTLTLASVAAWDQPPPVRFEKRLYEASCQTLLKMLKDLPGDVGHVMIVGHNPGLQELAVALASPGSREQGQLKEKLPTAGIVSFEFEEKLWKKLRPESGRIVLILSPKTLPASGQGSQK